MSAIWYMQNAAAIEGVAVKEENLMKTDRQTRFIGDYQNIEAR